MDKPRNDFLAHGHGKTAAWLDLVNSAEWDSLGRFTEHLHNPAWIPYFLRQWHFAGPRCEAVPFDKLQALRATLRKSSEAIFGGKPVAPPQLRSLNEFLNLAGKRQVFQRQNGLQLEFVPDQIGWNCILAEVARSFVDTVSHGQPARIKICRNKDCRWIFYDQTKAKSRCWCSSKSCGNRERVRRARARN